MTTDEFAAQARNSGVPEHLIDGMTAYVYAGRPPGDFLRAVFENDLCRAVGSADENSLQALPPIVRFVYQWFPSNVWGDRQSVKTWLVRHYSEVRS